MPSGIFISERLSQPPNTGPYVLRESPITLKLFGKEIDSIADSEKNAFPINTSPSGNSTNLSFESFISLVVLKRPNRYFNVDGKITEVNFSQP